jgi:hypothetical protein
MSRLLPQLERQQWEEFIKYAIVMALGGMMYIPNFMTIDSGSQVMLRVLHQQFDRL